MNHIMSLNLMRVLIILIYCGFLKFSFAQKTAANVNLDTLQLFDESRQRAIPIAVYKPITPQKKYDLVIFSHGYGANYSKNYLAYSYITSYLASNGYYVVSIQHELKNDSLLPASGIPQIVRRPIWERGVENIRFVLNEMNGQIEINKVILIGHSNGGDMSVLYPQIYPNTVQTIITLDHLRMAIPKEEDLKIVSLRSSNLSADEGVLPNEKELEMYPIEIIQLKNIKHNDMNDFSKRKYKKTIQKIILDCLQSNN